MIIKSTAGSTLRFLWRDYGFRFRDDGHARQFLAEFKSDPVAMASMRNLLAEHDWRVAPARMTDDDVLRAVASLLCSGELVAGFEWKPRISAPVKPEEAAPATAPAARESAAEEPEQSTFGGDHDPAAQAAALMTAAQQGVPFCEECARAAARGGAQ